VCFVNTDGKCHGFLLLHLHDGSLPDRGFSFGTDDGTPNRYAHFWNDASPPYIAGSAGAETSVNFFNPSDYALGKWTLDQDLKPDA
jgi:hypothetical protein